MNHGFNALVLVTLLGLGAANLAEAAQEDRYSGVDEAVVEQAARKAGRTPRSYVSFLEQGDIPLMMSVLAGLVGGFALGYIYRGHFAGRKPDPLPPTSVEHSGE
jgi:hypothetical protein